MADKEIGLKVSVTGGDAAAAEIKKVEKSTEDLGTTTNSVAGTASKLKGIAAAAGAIGVATAAAAKTFGQIRDEIDSIDITQLRAVDSAMADNIESAKSWATALEDPIGALLEYTTGETVASAFAGMNEQLALVAKQHEQAIDRLIAKGITQRDELKAMAAEIKAANAILDAKDDADGKARDRADAAAIRDGANPEDVAAKRAQDDGEKEISKINRGLDSKAPEVQAAYDNLTAAKGNAERVANTDGAKAADIEKAKKQVEDLQKEYDNQSREFETAKKVAEEARRGAREEASGKTEALAADKAERLQKEKAAAEKKAADEKARADKEAAKQADAQLREERRLSGGSSSGRSSRGGRSSDDEDNDEPSKGSDPFRKLSAVEDGHRRAALRAKDREDRAGARQRDREERGGRKPGSLELRDREDSTGIPRGAVDQFREDVKKVSGGGDQMGEILSIMRQLSSALAGGGGKDYSSEIAALKRQVEVNLQRCKNSR